MVHAPFSAVDGFMLGSLLKRPSARRVNQESSARNRFATCSIRVSISGFVRIWRILRKPKSVKFFAFNRLQWFESHPLRQTTLY